MVDKAALIAALLSTTAISLAPNLILLLSPNFASSSTNKSNPILKIGQALAAGALIGDVFLHTLPHMMVDSCDGHDGHGHDGHGVAETLGLSILFGFCAFFAFDVLVRAFGEDHHHSHTSSHSHDDSKSSEKEETTQMKIFTPTVILNLASDAMHNFTDGLAIGASFAVSSMAFHDEHDHHDHHHHDHDHHDHSTDTNSIHYDSHSDCCALLPKILSLLQSRGGLATLAILMHEIPHELGDFAVLVSNGMSKRQAIQAQFLTAVAAFCGTIVGLYMVEKVQEMVGFDILVPFTAGGFLYVAAVGILPSLLEDEGHSHGSTNVDVKQKRKEKMYQLIAFFVGIAFMYGVALLEEHDHEHGHSHGHSHGHHTHEVVSTPVVDHHEHSHHDDHHHDHHHEEGGACCEHGHDHDHDEF